MRKFILVAASAIALATGAGLMTGGAQAAPFIDDLNGLTPLGNFETVQFFAGHRYCWYPLGWQGPGWYWCGYANRHGLGWGGGEGWHGFRGPGRREPPRREGRPGPGPRGGDHDRGDRGRRH